MYNIKCNICSGIYKNSSNTAFHCQNCLKKREHAKKHSYMNIIKAFGLVYGDEVPIEAVEPETIPPSKIMQQNQFQNIPFTHIETPAWDNFIHTLKPGFVIPMKDQLRNLIIEYSHELTEKGLDDLRGCTCGLAVDGATLMSLHEYAFILFSKKA